MKNLIHRHHSIYLMENELFNDLPEGETPDQGESEADRQKAKELELATKKEESRLAKAKEKLDKARALRKETDAKVEKIEAGEDVDDEEEAPPAVVPDVKQEVQKALEEQKREQYLASVAEQIKGLAKNRQEALAVYEEAQKLPPTGNAKLDAEFAFDRVQKLRHIKKGFVPPAVSGSFADLPGGEERNDLGMSKGQIQHLKNYGLTDEDIKKYKGGVDFNRAWIKR